MTKLNTKGEADQTVAVFPAQLLCLLPPPPPTTTSPPPPTPPFVKCQLKEKPENYFVGEYRVLTNENDGWLQLSSCHKECADQFFTFSHLQNTTQFLN